MKLWLLALFVFCVVTEISSDSGQHYLNEFAVKVSKGFDVSKVVKTHGFRVLRKIHGLDDVYVLEHENVPHRSKRSATDVAGLLQQDPRIKHIEQQKTLIRTKRTIIHDKQWELPIKHYDDKSVYQRVYEQNNRLQAKDKIPQVTKKIKEAGFKDPYFSDQWYLINEGQTGGTPGYDVNVLPVWQKGFTGQGVVVTILDDGIDHTHPDLEQNYDAEASGDINDRSDKENDPMPDTHSSGNSHGTRCAGEVAAQANNSVCGVGIAYNAKIGGVRMLDGRITDSLEAEALTYHNQHIDIYSASWGPSDDGKTLESPGTFASEALEKGAKEGRGGKGSIFVWATGNGGVVQDDCSCDGYVSSIYTLSVGCISDKGLSTYFSEVCPSTMAVIFTGGSHLPPGEASKSEKPHVKVVTTDLDGECTLEFQGTSSAAPLAAGCFALVLEANPDLSWRDLQHIVVQTARVPNAEEEGWTLNGAGFHVNNKFGFGAVDCGKMVEVAQTWTNVPAQHECHVESDNGSRNIFCGQTINQTLHTDGCQTDAHHAVFYLEHTQVHISLTHEKRGDLSINLYSPAGTHSEILSIRPLDHSKEGIEYTFMTVHNWGENPQGEWTLTITDHSDRTGIYNIPSDRHKVGTLNGWSLTLWGHASQTKADKSSKRASADSEDMDMAHKVDEEELENIMAAEERSSEQLQITETIESPDELLSDEDMKELEKLFDDYMDEEKVHENKDSTDDISEERNEIHKSPTARNHKEDIPGKVPLEDYEEETREVLANLSDEDLIVLLRILSDEPVSERHYRRLLHHLDMHIMEEHEKNQRHLLPGIKVQQRSLLDKALARILPEKKTATTTTTTPAQRKKSYGLGLKDTKENIKNPSNYNEIIKTIDSILSLLDKKKD